MLRKSLCALLVFITIFIGAAPAQAAVLSKSERYEALLSELENHLYGEESMPLKDLFLQFSMLSSYKMSSCFALYVKILQDIEEEEYGQVFLRLETLRLNTEFLELLEASEVFGTVDELEAYALGRQAESMGEPGQALAYYGQCPSFMDAFARLTLLMDTEFAEKYDKAIEYFITDTEEGYRSAYAIFSELAETSYQDSASLAAMCLLMLESYIPSEIAKPASESEPIEATGSEPIETTASEAEPAPVPAAPATPAEAVSDTGWSEWTDVLPKEITKDLYEIEEKTQYSSRTKQRQYRYRSITTQYRKRTLSKITSTVPSHSGWTNTGSFYEYGAWSDWSRTAVTANASLEVEKKTDTVYKEVKTYNYNRYKYYNTSHNAWFYSYTSVAGAAYCKSGSGSWQYTSSSTPLAIEKYVDGRAQYSGIYYNESITTASVPETVTLYRSRTKTLRYTHEQWSNWSDWSTTAVSASSTVQVETKKVYGSWSRWQDSYVSETAARDTERRNVFGDPTPWQDEEIVKADNLEVSTRTVYRYRLLEAQ